MKTWTIKNILCLAATLGLTFPACPQLVHIRFTSEVTEDSGQLLPGVSVGSIITGKVDIDLAYFPHDDAFEGLIPDFALYSYSGQGRPGYIFQFDTGVQTFTLNS